MYYVLSFLNVPKIFMEIIWLFVYKNHPFFFLTQIFMENSDFLAILPIFFNSAAQPSNSVKVSDLVAQKFHKSNYFWHLNHMVILHKLYTLPSIQVKCSSFFEFYSLISQKCQPTVLISYMCQLFGSSTSYKWQSYLTSDNSISKTQPSRSASISEL